MTLSKDSSSLVLVVLLGKLSLQAVCSFKQMLNYMTAYPVEPVCCFMNVEVTSYSWPCICIREFQRCTALEGWTLRFTTSCIGNVMCHNVEHYAEALRKTKGHDAPPQGHSAKDATHDTKTQRRTRGKTLNKRQHKGMGGNAVRRIWPSASIMQMEQAEEKRQRQSYHDNYRSQVDAEQPNHVTVPCEIARTHASFDIRIKVY